MADILSALGPGGLIVVILIIVGLITAVKGIMIVEQATVTMVERLGKFHKMASSGINFIWPFVDKIRPFVMRDQWFGFVDLREQVMDFPPSSVITRDNVTMEVDAVLFYQITDPMKATYEITNLGNAIVQLTITSLRNVMGELALDETLTSRETVNVKLRDILDVLQRLYVIAPRGNKYSAMAALAAEGLLSANAIMARGRAKFLLAFESRLGGKEIATEIFENAERSALASALLHFQE